MEQREEVDQTVKNTHGAGWERGRNEEREKKELLRPIPGLCELDESEPLRQWLSWRNFSINHTHARARTVKIIKE